MQATSRRSVLTGLVGGIAGTLLGRLGGPPGVAAADGDPIVMGTTNTAGTPTVLALPSTLPGPIPGPALRVESSGDSLGIAIEAHSKEDFAIVADAVWGAIKATSPNGPALHATSTDSEGVSAYSEHATGVHTQTGGAPENTELESRRDFALWAQAVRGIGVLATTGPTAVPQPPIATNIAVHGVALDGADARGVYGRSGAGMGVRGEATTGIGVYARSTTSTGTALRVSGRSVFSSARRATIGAGASSVVISIPGVSSASVVVATLLRNVPGTYVRAAVPSTGSVRIILNRAVTSSTPVSCFAVN
jgi:hypothetical protein